MQYKRNLGDNGKVLCYDCGSDLDFHNLQN